MTTALTTGAASATATKNVLQRHLAAQRAHVLGAVDGIDEVELRRAALPSGWSPLGLIQHLTYDVEALWFGAVMGGDDDTIGQLAALGDAWQVPEDLPAAQVLQAYRERCRRADEIIAATALEAAPRWWPEGFGDWRLADLRDTLLHVIVETAAHAGHLDAARELLDGRQWLVV